ncbi:MAG: RecX family transcriptional regulator [Chloroflexi bacterium]|nr:RecX family transcriptional regulator [Chloroflexota bacterium]
MRKITAIRIGKTRGKRVNVLLDNKFAFSLEAEVAIREGLLVEQELSAGQIETLVRSDRFHRCFNTAAHYLSYRPRSEFELRERLHRRGFDDSIEEVIAKLKEQGLVDDVAFAQFWKDNRESFSPRSRWLIQLELRRKGIADEIIDEVVDKIDDNNNAYRAALSKARSLPLSDYQGFRHRLGEYLKRRGFNYRVIDHIVEQLWHEWGKKA